MTTIYLLHFSRPLGRVQHYLGQTARSDVMERIREHRAGRGARMTRGAVRAGVELLLVRIWEDAPRSLEQRLKNKGGFRRICPVCKKAKKVAEPARPPADRIPGDSGSDQGKQGKRGYDPCSQGSRATRSNQQGEI